MHCTSEETKYKTEYDVVLASTHLSLIQQVNAKLQEGFEVQGGVSRDAYNNYCQALTRQVPDGTYKIETFSIAADR